MQTNNPRATVGARQDVNMLRYQEKTPVPEGFCHKPGHIPGKINTSGKTPPRRTNKTHHPLVYVSKEDRMAAFALRKKLRQSDRMHEVMKKFSVFGKHEVMKALDITESAARAALASWNESGLIEAASTNPDTGLIMWRKKS